MDAQSENLSLDSDIAEAIQNMRYLSQKYIKANEDRYELEQERKSLKNELQNAQEIERSQSNSINSSRKLITTQQTIIAQLVNVKEEINTYKDELKTKDKIMNELEEDISMLKESFDREKDDLLGDFQSKLEKFKSDFECEVNNLKSELEVVTCKAECEIRSLNNKIRTMQDEKDEQISLMVLEYEERLQRANAINLQKSNEIKTNNDKYNSNILLYRRKIEELERNKLHEKVPDNSFRMQPVLHNNYVLDTSNNSASKQRYSKPRETFKMAPKTTKRPTATLEVQYSNGSVLNTEKESEPPKLLVKPTKRKLFNKDTECFDA